MAEIEPFPDDVIADMAHRVKCLVAQGNRNCICADYAAVTGLLHPDCPRHGYVERPKNRKNGGK